MFQETEGHVFQETEGHDDTYVGTQNHYDPPSYPSSSSVTFFASQSVSIVSLTIL